MIVSCISRAECIRTNVALTAIEGCDTLVREVWVVTKKGHPVLIHRLQSNVSHLLRRSSTFFLGGATGLAIVTRSPKGS